MFRPRIPGVAPKFDKFTQAQPESAAKKNGGIASVFLFNMVFIERYPMMDTTYLWAIFPAVKQVVPRPSSEARRLFVLSEQ